MSHNVIQFPDTAQRLLPSPPAPTPRLSTSDDLARWFHTKPTPMPHRYTKDQLAAMSPVKRQQYNEERTRYLQAFPVIADPQKRAAFDIITGRIQTNQLLAQPDAPGVRITGRTHTGKTTLVRAVAYDTFRRAHEEGRHDPDAKPVSTVYSQGSAATTPKALISSLLAFFGPQYVTNDSLDRLEHRLYHLMNECGTTLLILDEAHRFSATDSHGRQTIDAIRSLQSAVPGLTVVLAGVDLDRKPMFTANRRFTSIEAEQMRARFPRVILSAYTDTGIDYDAPEQPASEDRQVGGFMHGIVAAAPHLPLASDHATTDFGLGEGQLAQQLYVASEGRFGSAMRRVIEATMRAISDGTERLSAANMNLDPIS